MQAAAANLTIVTSPEGLRIYPLRDFTDAEVDGKIEELRKIYGEEVVKVRRYVGDFTYRVIAEGNTHEDGSAACPIGALSKPNRNENE